MTGQNKLKNTLVEQHQAIRLAIARPTVPRDCLQKAATYLPSTLIKVITGPRRCGKSTLALQLVAGKNFGFLDCDDPDFLRYLDSNDSLGLLDALRTEYGSFEYLVIDEIQNIAGWELLVSKLQKHHCNLIITGSNANLLSQELATHLTGRYHEIPLLPLSWNEFKAWSTQSDVTFDSYLRIGGFPELTNSGVSQESYLDSLTNSILLKDIVQRYKIRQPMQLISLWQTLRAQFAQYVTITKLANTLEFASKMTLQKYLHYLESSYLCVQLTRYHHKFKEQLKAPRKIYLIDTGLVSPLSLPFDASSRILENCIFLGLKRICDEHSLHLFYGTTERGYEVDFIIRDHKNTIGIIQVCYSLDSATTQTREIRALEDAAVELNCRNVAIITHSAQPVRPLSQAVDIAILSPEVFLQSAVRVLHLK